ncbi:MAG: bifunctional phosphoglucose/phosphomannose isomerase [Acidimicrobiia bacterium]|nr:bifunctional phosphoglucose/phosphomannose isomerase [bacterium]MXX44963.1 bifunctional phosphoglucose/phosphomannose isomerase [Acidimicrobiia bacterium]MDE0674414.1 bifunctional phosphoglucose/phosphomannose isomerase [bacterium]MXY73455.1 bifunctional phosphoglucose/phosphomannose isomerase [Acidimicrobiia bacterium]MYA39963.1 bifunctional phosphoglucose/phosphomannose isomerase [Acidimicrobiia bacterium]
MTEKLSGMEEMRSQMAALGAQLRWGADLDLPVGGHPDGEMLVCGMGGSGITGDFLSAVAATEGRRTSVHKDYGLPGWAAREKPSVVVVSYSGDTSEALSSWESARDLGLSVTVVTTGGKLGEIATRAGHRAVTVPGGFQPRSALGYGLSAVLRVAAAAGAIGDPRPSLEEAASIADSLSGPEGGGQAIASDLAAAMADRMVGIYGSSPLTTVAAYRWKTQINENAKRAAFRATMPEATHNEITGWDFPTGLADSRVGLVALRDRDEHPGVSKRFGHLEALTADRVSWTGEVWAQGSSPLARLISLVAVGDLFSLELARVAGADPVRVELIDRLKERMTPSPDSGPRAF